jgi:hypothetical protein
LALRTAPAELLYRLHQSAWSAWARRRYREEMAGVERFCLFVGYPRSGHSIVGALINAHRDAVMAHELVAAPLILDGCSREALFSRILARAYWWNLRGNRSNYDYAVPNQWQGRFRTLRVIGDKRGGSVSRTLTEHPDFLRRVRDLVRVPMRLVHVVRNPFDNIAAISVDNRLALPDAIDYYFLHCRGTARLPEFTQQGELLTLHHEEMVRDPEAFLTGLLGFLELEPYPGYVEDCCSIVFRKPTYSRRKVTWPAEAIRDVEHRMREYQFLTHYGWKTPEK